MTDREAIDILLNELKCIDRNDGIQCDRKCESCDLVMDAETIREAYNMAISALQAQDSKTRKICDTCKHDPPSKKWPCVDCDLREPADRWKPKDVPDTNVGDIISRRKAIDALMEILDRPNHAEFLYTDEICKVLNALPSVTPDRCDTCRFVYYPKETNNNDE